jgi:hypothetical protein
MTIKLLLPLKKTRFVFVRGDRMVGNSVQSQRHFSSVSNVWYDLVQN